MIFSSFLKGFYTFFRQTFCYAYAFPLHFFLFLKILHLVLYLTNFLMIGLLLPLFLGAPSLCDLSISSFSISFHIFSLIVTITSSSVFSFFDSGRPWISNQFFLGTSLNPYLSMKKCNFRFDVNALLVKKNFKDNFLWYFFTASNTSYLYHYRKKMLNYWKYGILTVFQLFFEVHAPFLKTSGILANFKQFGNFCISTRFTKIIAYLLSEEKN